MTISKNNTRRIILLITLVIALVVATMAVAEQAHAGVDPPPNFAERLADSSSMSAREVVTAYHMSQNNSTGLPPWAEERGCYFYQGNKIACPPGTDLSYVTGWEGAGERGARFPGANMNYTEHSGTNWTGSVMDGVTLYGADLYNGHFIAVDFGDSDFTGALVQNANFERAIMTDVIGLETSMLVEANCKNATMPANVDATVCGGKN